MSFAEIANSALSYVQDPSNRALLGWFGAGLIPLVAGIWAVLKFNIQSKRQAAAAAASNAELNGLVRKLLDDRTKTDSQQRSELLGVIAMLNQRLDAPNRSAEGSVSTEPAASASVNELTGQVGELLARMKTLEAERGLGGTEATAEGVRPAAAGTRETRQLQEIARALNNYGAPRIGISKSRWRILGWGALALFTVLVVIGVVQGLNDAGSSLPQMGSLPQKVSLPQRPLIQACSANTAFETMPNNFTPIFLVGGRVIDTCEVENIAGGGNGTLLVDVLPQPHQTIPGAYRVPLTNQYAFINGLQQLTGGNLSQPIVFFCHGPSCNYSFQAAEIAISNGYSQVMWYRGGLEAWQQAGQNVQ